MNSEIFSDLDKVTSMIRKFYSSNLNEQNAFLKHIDRVLNTLNSNYIDVIFCYLYQIDDLSIEFIQKNISSFIISLNCLPPTICYITD